MIVFLAPPWGDALDPVNGLDLRRTEPPIADVIGFFDTVYANNRLLYVTQVHEIVNPDSLTEISGAFERSALKVYHLNEAGKNHGILLGTKRWVS